MQSSNPALSPRAFQDAFGSAVSRDVATAGGVAVKTAMFVSIAAALGGVGYGVVRTNPGLMLPINLVALVVTLGVFFGIRAKPSLAMALGFLYATVQGFLLGGVAAMLDLILAQSARGLPGGVALTAALMTCGVTAAMLLLYTMRIVKPSRTLAMVLSSATLGIGLVYLAAFLVSWLVPSWAHVFKFVTLQSAMDGGSGAWLGLGINVVILLVASFWLVLDFGRIEEALTSGAPKSGEWYLAFGLLVTLAWVYFECLKMAFRIAQLLGARK
ncbi:MAG: Bax inhibitor-1/YccA family protein [Phycisphaerae bacterium]|nr:Bax inhibitor-1/YccA family protein [Phycisphaerae bacterium]